MTWQYPTEFHGLSLASNYNVRVQTLVIICGDICKTLAFASTVEP